MEITDKHHIVWYKKDYSKGWAKRLRDHWYCSVEIPRDTLHRQIHCEVPFIPVPRVVSIEDALFQLLLLERHGSISQDDSIKKRLMVLCALFDRIEPRTHEALRKQYDLVCKFYSKNPR